MKHTLFVVGDSTVSAFKDQYYMPRYGWGTQLFRIFNDQIEIRNLAISGTSSKSFLTRENYQTFLKEALNGDFLMIGFGHNDEKTGAVTFTSGTGDYKTPGSFAASLYRNYIEPARQRGLSVVLATPIVRRSEDGRYEGALIHQTKDGDYAEAIRSLGRDLGIPVCDLTARTLEISRELDSGETSGSGLRSLDFHARTGSREICTDDTHTNLYGAVLNAWLIREELKRSDSPLCSYLTDTLKNPLEHPETWQKLSVNSSYVEPVYSAPREPGKIWPSWTDEHGNVWYGTVFGDVDGKAESREDFRLGPERDGSLEICAGLRGNAGKIMRKSDGIAMYFTRIPAGTSFDLSAEVEIESFNTAGSPATASGFGLMVRDDMYIDEQNGSIMGDYVAGGVLFNDLYPTGASTFARKSGLPDFEGGALPEAPKAGSRMHFRIFSTGDGYGAEADGRGPVISGYDFPLNAVDPAWVYIGFFAARTISVKVRAVSLRIDGKEAENYHGF